jgi:hypothetical protein
VRKLGLLLVVANVLWMAACGGGGGGSSSSSITGVSVSCLPSTITSGGTSQCSATVSGTGSFSTAVNWSTSAGTISSSGLLSAPQVTSTVSVTVTATSTQDNTKSGTASVTVNPSGGTASNVAPMIVDQGPEPQTFLATNQGFVSVTLCNPTSNTCQTIDHVEVDTGSSGLRLLQNVLTISLPQNTAPNGSPLDECLVFLDGFVWGPVSSATITVGGESASNVPVQVIIPSSSSPAPPSSCSGQTTGPNEGDSVEAFGANGIIGVGLFQNDCGNYCASQGASCNGTSNFPCFYYSCSSSSCSPTNLPNTQQVPNPVTDFAVDNNGVLIQLPSVPDGGSPTVSGSLIFGIGTESNNGLGSVNVYAVPDSGSDAGDFTTTYNGNSIPGFVDSGSNGYFFADSSIPTCPSPNQEWYCPTTSPDNLTAQNQGTNMSSPITVNFSIEDATTLFNGNNFAFSTLAGAYPSNSPGGPAFDWGLSFFFGKSVFTAIDGASTPGGTGPYIAY